ncbi:MAG: cadherin-like domain-containing protein [Rhodospirillales bacterium]|nr:cadherin-like domain-containing protein [Rhodospirillales bacterium]
MTEELGRQEIANKALLLLPSDLNTDDVVISSAFYDLYNKTGDYAYNFLTYQTDYRYNILTLSGGLKIQSDETQETYFENEFTGEFSFFNDPAVSAQSTLLDIWNFSYNNSGQIETGPRVKIFGLIENDTTINTSTGDITSDVAILDVIGLLNPTAKDVFGWISGGGVQIFLNNRGEADGGLGYVSTEIEDIFVAKFGIGERRADVKVGLDTNPNFEPLDYSTAYITAGYVYDEMRSLFPNLALTKEEFVSRTEANYAYGRVESINEAAGIVMYQTLIGSTPSDSTPLGSRDWISTVINAQKNNLENQDILDDFNGYTEVVFVEAQESQQPLPAIVSEEDFPQLLNENSVLPESDSKIQEIKDIKVGLIKQDGTTEEIIVNPADHKIEFFESEFADVKVNGIVIAQTTETLTRSDGSVVNNTQTIFEDFQGNRYLETSSVLADGSLIPSNGVRSETTVLRLTGDNQTGYSRTTVFDKDGLTHQTQEYQETTQDNVTIKQNVLRPDGNGGYVELDGPVYVVPSSELLVTLQTLGSTAGGLLANHLADDNIYQQVFYSAALKTIGTHFGSVGAYLATGSDLEALINVFKGAEVDQNAQITVQLTDDILDTFASNLQAASAGALAGIIVDEVGEALGIDGTIGGEIFDVVAGTVTTGFVSDGLGFIVPGLDGGVYSGLLANGFDLSAVYHPPGLIGPPPPGTPTYGEMIQIEVFNALGAYAGSRLAGEVVEPESQTAAIFGSIGSVIGSKIIATYAIELLASTTLKALGSIILPGVGTLIGAFIGQVAGTVLGNLFDGEDLPAAGARIVFDRDTGQYAVGSTSSDDGGDESIARSMAEATYNGVNEIIAMTQGSIRRTSGVNMEIGFDDHGYFVTYNGDLSRFDQSGEAIKYAALKLLQGSDLVGGHAILMRAWNNSEAVTLEGFRNDIMIAEAFQKYLLNPTGVLALMMNEPESADAQQWSFILQRAAELELHLPHEKDIDGGWGELLAARGDINPELVPDIRENSIVLTNPITGEEIVLEYVIGPGYEIVRIPGTDGNDVIEVVVDGPSIAYVDAGPGDDTFVGHDGRDIFIGGAGDDNASGGDGDDWLLGGDGDDVLFGQAGDDFLVGGDGDDTLKGGDGIDTIYGGNGNDSLKGDADIDYLYGGAGDDYIWGEEGVGNQIEGGDGNDEIYTFVGETATPGRGDDYVALKSSTAVIYRNDGHDTFVVQDYVEGKSVLRFDQMIAPQELEFSKHGNDLVITVLGEDQSVTLHNAYIYPANWLPRLQIWGEEGRDGPNVYHDVGIYTGEGISSRDIYIGYASDPDGVLQHGIVTGFYTSLYIDDAGAIDNVVQGTEGNDNLQDQHPAQTVFFYGNGGDDLIRLGGGNDFGVGGTGSDVLQGGAGDDVLYGGSGVDYVNGEDGNDKIYGGSGDDFMYGRQGNDIIYGDDGNDSIVGDEGRDTIYGNAGHDTISGGTENDLIYGGEGDDTISGDDGDDKIDGESGHDILIGASGADSIDGGAGDDILKGGAGDDALYGDVGVDLAYGGEGDDWIGGGAGDDVLSGGVGSDVLNGGDDNDTLAGGTGSDTLDGGHGDDTYVFSLAKQVIAFNESETGGYAILNNAAVGVNNMTVAFTYQFSEGANFDTIFLNYAASVNSHAEFKVNHTPGVGVTIQIAGTTYRPGNYLLEDHAEHNIVVSWDGDNGVVSFYDNGSLIQTFTGAYTGALEQGGTLTLAQGQSSAGIVQSGYALVGTMSEVTIWGRALDASEVANGFDKSNALHDFEFNGQNQPGVLVNKTGNGDMQMSGDYAWSETSTADLAYIESMGVDIITDAAGQDTLSFGAGIALGDLTFERDINDPHHLLIKLHGVHIVTIVNQFNGKSIETLLFADGESVSLGDVEVASIGTPPNIAPVAVNDVFSGDQDTQITGNVLSDNGNGADSDPDGDALSVAPATIITPHGSVELLANGDFTYTPDPGYVGTDDFTYALLDGQAVNTMGNVTLTLISIPHDIVGTVQNDTLYGTLDHDIMRGLDGDDYLNGGDNDDTLYGGAGADTLNGGADNDTLWGQDGNDTLYGGGGSDYLNGGGDDDVLKGNAGDDMLYGHNGNDILYGGNDDDYLNGGADDDTLYGGSGADRLTGSFGADSFVFLKIDGMDADWITDFNVGQGDRLDISDLLTAYDPLTDAITDFVHMTSDGTHSYLRVDADGGADNFIQIAQISNVTGLGDEEALETAGTLITV